MRLLPFRSFARNQTSNANEWPTFSFISSIMYELPWNSGTVVPVTSKAPSENAQDMRFQRYMLSHCSSCSRMRHVSTDLRNFRIPEKSCLAPASLILLLPIETYRDGTCDPSCQEDIYRRIRLTAARSRCPRPDTGSGRKAASTRPSYTSHLSQETFQWRFHHQRSNWHPKTLNLLVLTHSPVQPGRHLHSNLRLSILRQVPPFWQGSDAQGFRPHSPVKGKKDVDFYFGTNRQTFPLWHLQVVPDSYQFQFRQWRRRSQGTWGWTLSELLCCQFSRTWHIQPDRHPLLNSWTPCNSKALWSDKFWFWDTESWFWLDSSYEQVKSKNKHGLNLLLRGIRDVAHVEGRLEVEGLEGAGGSALLRAPAVQPNLPVLAEASRHHLVEGVQLHLVRRHQHNWTASQVVSEKKTGFSQIRATGVCGEILTEREREKEIKQWRMGTSASFRCLFHLCMTQFRTWIPHVRPWHWETWSRPVRSRSARRRWAAHHCWACGTPSQCSALCSRDVTAPAPGTSDQQTTASSGLALQTTQPNFKRFYTICGKTRPIKSGMGTRVHTSLFLVYRENRTDKMGKVKVRKLM